MALLKRAFIRRISGRAAGLPAPPAPHSSSCVQDTRERDTNGVVRATSLMNRYVVLARSAWPRMRPASCPSNVATLVRYQTFHSTAPAGSIGFKNFKNSPRLDWKVSTNWSIAGVCCVLSLLWRLTWCALVCGCVSFGQKPYQQQDGPSLSVRRAKL